jgi:pimeloyl-ACP methyl ester carboxylesterase
LGASSNGGKYFDIIGFDPRGVNNTTPTANCFPDDPSLSTWLQRADAQGAPYSNESFANSWSRHASLARSCTWRLGDDGDDEVMGIGRYVNTPSVVEDMRAIVEALGESREREAKQQSKLENLQLTPEIQEATRWKRGEEKLLYMGFSYGTLLGATFAAMHPDRVGRIALDAVVNADDYYSGRNGSICNAFQN